MYKLFHRGKDNSADASPTSTAATPSPSASPVTGPARPIRLVYCDDKGKFHMDPEAVATLQLVKEPIGVVSVCGRARQGKSFILNQLLGRSSGFQVAPTHRPCTKGLWLWSTPLKRTALDGTEYNLLLLDSEGIDAYDQTGTYSTQIFSLAVLLSSMFIYNQMGGIDEAALDRLSLVTQMTKHIRVRASGGKTSASELGQFSPIFVWLLRDFYLDLTEDNKKITPRDYLELALRPVQGSGRDIAAKNEIRDSIRALFPDRECFTLVRPLNKENDLQRLDQISLDKLRPEFRSGLDALTKFVFERTRPKQVGATMMTGPVLIGITESYLNALNHGAVPTISSSWQSVEETECHRAYDSATEVYMSSFDRSKPPEEAALREAHEEAVQKSMATFNASAVGVGSARKKYEGLLQKFFKKAFEDYKRTAFMEADLQCSNAIHSMEKRLRAACNASGAKIDNVAKVLDALLTEYEKSIQGPGKWQKLAAFLQQSFEGPVLDLAKRLIDKVESDKNSIALQCRMIEDKMTLLNKRLDATESDKSEYIKRYEDAINDKKKLTDEYMNRITDLQANRRSLEERYSSLLKTLDSTKQESGDWKRKYEQVLSRHKAEEDQASSEIAALKSRSGAAEARLAAAKEQAQSAQEKFSAGLRIGDLNDFIAPSQACIVSLKGLKSNASKPDIKPEVSIAKKQVQSEPVKISLKDCLACSGCVTSAETVMLEKQSLDEFLSNINKGKTVIVSLSPQSRASLAVHFGISPLQVFKKLTNFFKSLGVKAVFDTSCSRDLTLVESCMEFMTRYRQNQLADGERSKSSLPMIASACPGWICYAEKQLGSFVLPNISKVKSPQQTIGTIIKQYLCQDMGLRPEEIYHVTVMPCYDKKLEAARDDFVFQLESHNEDRGSDGNMISEVDSVLTTGEVMELIQSKDVDFKSLEESPLDRLLTNINEEGYLYGVHGSSGGYAETIFRYAAKTLFGRQIDGPLNFKKIRNSDFQEVTLEVEGKTVLKFALCYGFRNLQNVVRKLKTGTCDYQFVEIMACPSGCLNGGGQIKPKTGQSPKELSQLVETVYMENVWEAEPFDNPIVRGLYDKWLGQPGSEKAQRLMHTQYHHVEKSITSQLHNW